MLTDQLLMALHVQALFTHNSQGRIVCINEPKGAESAPRFFLGRTPHGNLWRFRADLPDALMEALQALCADEPIGEDIRNPPRHVEAYLRLLEADAPAQQVAMGPAYHIPEHLELSRPLLALTEANAALLQNGFEELVAELPDWQPFVALVEEGRAVSVCRSARITSTAHEAGVETLPDFRGRGYAQDVVAGWARLVRSVGALPLYSTSWKNTASQAVAHNLRMEAYGADFHIT